MKARPATSIRLASKQHAFGNSNNANASSSAQHFATGGANSQTLKLSQTAQGGRQFANNRTMEVHNVPGVGQTIQMKSSLAHQQQ